MLYSKIKLLFSSIKLFYNSNIDTQSINLKLQKKNNLEIQYNNLNKFKYISNLRLKIFKISYHNTQPYADYYNKYILPDNIPTIISKLSIEQVTALTHYNSVFKLNNIPNLNIFILSEISEQHKPKLIDLDNIKFKYIYLLNESIPSEKLFMDMKYDTSTNKHFIKINTNKFDKKYLLELKEPSIK